GMFHANDVYFDQPDYAWNWNGGNVQGALSDQLANGDKDIDATPNEYLLGFDGVELGGNQYGTGMHANTILHLTTTDTDGREISSQKTIYWHLPLEEQLLIDDDEDEPGYD